MAKQLCRDMVINVPSEIKTLNRVSYKVFRGKSRGHTYQIGTVFYKAVTEINLGIELN